MSPTIHRYGATERGVVSDVWRWDGSAWHFVGGNAGGVEQMGVCSPRGLSRTTSLPTARHAGYNFDFPAPTGRMLVMGGEHEQEKFVFNDMWSHELCDDCGWAFEAGDCNVPNVLNASHRAPGQSAEAFAPASTFSGNGWSDNATGTSWIFGGGPDAGYVSSLWRIRW